MDDRVAVVGGGKVLIVSDDVDHVGEALDLGDHLACDEFLESDLDQFGSDIQAGVGRWKISLTDVIEERIECCDGFVDGEALIGLAQ